MKIKTLIITILSILLIAPSLTAQNKGLSELTGTLNKSVKALSPYALKLDGGGQIYLRGEILKDISDGTRIWVKGEIKTELYNPEPQSLDNPTCFTSQWHIFMDAKECKKIDKLFERPK